MLHLIEYLDLGDMMNAFPSFCTIILMPFFYSIDHAIVAGLGACVSVNKCTHAFVLFSHRNLC